MAQQRESRSERAIDAQQLHHCKGPSIDTVLCSTEKPGQQNKIASTARNGQALAKKHPAGVVRQRTGANSLPLMPQFMQLGTSHEFVGLRPPIRRMQACT